MRIKLALLFLTLAMLACMEPTAELAALPVSTTTPEIDKKPAQISTLRQKPTQAPSTIKITGSVWKRDSDGIAHGSLQAGQIVEAWCGLELCYLQGADAGLTVFIGCTDKANGRKCEPK